MQQSLRCKCFYVNVVTDSPQVSPTMSVTPRYAVVMHNLSQESPKHIAHWPNCALCVRSRVGLCWNCGSSLLKKSPRRMPLRSHMLRKMPPASYKRMGESNSATLSWSLCNSSANASYISGKSGFLHDQDSVIADDSL